MSPRALVALLPVLVLACSGAEQPRPRTEDEARRAAPVPACVLHLPARKSSGGAVRSLREPEYWKLVYPDFDEQAWTIPTDPHVCTGQRLLAAPELHGAKPVRQKLEEGDALLGAGADRLKVVWLRSHQTDDGKTAGALALARGLETNAEAYAVGVFKGHPAKTRLGIERIGPEVVVTAIEDTCTGRAPQSACEQTLHAFLAWRGQLAKIAEITTEKVAYAIDSEPGIPGRIEYHLTTAVEFSPQGVRVLEQVRARTGDGKELRKVELDRMMVLDRGNPMKTTAEPLWPKIFPTKKG